jgi:transcriptional regulator with XRE-family HTH domain
MSIIEHLADTGAFTEGPARVNHRALHRLGTVRRLQGVSRATLARCMNVDAAEIRRQEDESNDLPLSALFAWQKFLGVPIAELLVDPEDAIAQPFRERAQFVRLMKTALSLLELAAQGAERHMAQAIVDQLLKIMPELEGVSPWNAVGTRRTLDELGAAALRMCPEDLFRKRRHA